MQQRIELLRYSPAKSSRYAALSFFAALFLIGQPWFCLPMIFLCWKFRALRNRVAIEADGDVIVVRPLWGSKRMAFNDLAEVRAERVRFNWLFVQRHLIFRAGSGLRRFSPIRLPLNLADIRPEQIDGLIAQIEALRLQRGGQRAAAAKRMLGPSALSDRDFTPEAALARFKAGNSWRSGNSAT